MIRQMVKTMPNIQQNEIWKKSSSLVNFELDPNDKTGEEEFYKLSKK